MKILIFLIFTILMVTSVNSVELVCTWTGENCYLGKGAVITMPNDPITIFGKPTTYINTVTTNLGFDHMFVVRYIPANIFKIFTNLKNLQMYNCGLSNLAPNFTMSCPVLSSFSVVDGNLQEIPEGFLQTCSNLLTLNFQYNQIKTVDKNAFRGLGNLQQIQISYNKITCLHSDLFLHTPLLTSAHFTFNKITAIDKNLFRTLKSIGTFDMRFNSITYLPVLNITSPAPTSLYLYVSGNPIYAINPNFCASFGSRYKSFDIVNIGSIPCLPQDKVFYRVNIINCQASADILKSCYANWIPTMTDNVDCVKGSGVCISSNIMSKFNEFVKYLPV